MHIKNTTPYVGKIKLRMERHPHYSGGDSWSKLNKIHLNLGFTKLVSRMYPNRKKDGFEINNGKIQKIIALTGGEIGKYEWWDVTNKKTGKHITLTKLPNPDIYEIDRHSVLENAFISTCGSYIGNIEAGWWYAKNQLRVSKKYPATVAIQYEKEFYNQQYLYHLGGHSIPTNKIIGYYGYSHRGGNLFKLGDMIFEQDYEALKEDYEPWEWFGYVKEYEDALAKAIKYKNDFDVHDIEYEGVSRFIPFAKRGKQIIKTWEDAELAAHNLSNYLG